VGAGLWTQLDNSIKPKYRHPQNLNNTLIGNNLILDSGTFMVHPTSISYNMSDALSFTN